MKRLSLSHKLSIVLNYGSIRQIEVNNDTVKYRFESYDKETPCISYEQTVINVSIFITSIYDFITAENIDAIEPEIKICPEWLNVTTAKTVYDGKYALNAVKYIYQAGKESGNPILLKTAKYLLDTFVK